MNKLIEQLKLVSRAKGYRYFIDKIKNYQKTIGQFYYERKGDLSLEVNLSFNAARKKEREIRGILKASFNDIEIIEHKKYMTKIEEEMQWLTWHLG